MFSGGWGYLVIMSGNDDVPQVDVMDLELDQLLGFMIGLTSSKAINYMGVDLKTGKQVDKDLGKAGVVIDLTSYMVDKLIPYVSEEEIKQLKGMVSDLQLNFVRVKD